jgi:hypothetical protein
MREITIFFDNPGILNTIATSEHCVSQKTWDNQKT